MHTVTRTGSNAKERTATCAVAPAEPLIFSAELTRVPYCNFLAAVAYIGTVSISQTMPAGEEVVLR
jgi:hypothetical protein